MGGNGKTARAVDIRALLELADPFEEVRLSVGVAGREGAVELSGKAESLLAFLPDDVLDRTPGGVVAEACDAADGGARLAVLV